MKERTLDSKRRKELIRAYKETSRDMGVYLIRNTDNGKLFVAASRDVRARINRHKMNLKTNTDQVAQLQQDWNRLGADVFEFETLDLLEPLEDADYDPTEDLAVLKQLWLDKLRPYGAKGYNNQAAEGSNLKR